MKAGLRHVQSFTGAYEFLSNAYPAWVEYEGLYFPTVEQAFQAAKTLDLAERKKFCGWLDADTVISMSSELEMREDWDAVQISVMRQLLSEKFSGYHAREGAERERDLRTLLLKTGTAILENGNRKDHFWGTVSGKGENHLGNLLMEIRNEIQHRDEKLEELKDCWAEMLEDLYCNEESTVADFKTLFLETWQYLQGSLRGHWIPAEDAALISSVTAFASYSNYPKNFKRWEIEAAWKFSNALVTSIADIRSIRPDVQFDKGCILVEEFFHDYMTVRIDEFEQEFSALCKRYWENDYADEEDFNSEKDAE